MIITKYIPYLISHRERESVNRSGGKPDDLSNQAASVLLAYAGHSMSMNKD